MPKIAFSALLGFLMLSALLDCAADVCKGALGQSLQHACLAYAPRVLLPLDYKK